MDRLLVILDLDETLVHVPEHRLARAPDFVASGLVPHAWEHPVYVRPHLEEFLSGLRERYAVAIWTAAGSSYAEAIVSRVIPWWKELAFLWSAEHCTRHFDHETRDHTTIKKLRKVASQGYDLSRVVMVDDSPEKHLRNYGNLVPVSAFCGDLADAELPPLLEYVHALDAEPNVRAVEKRHWRMRAR